MQIMRHMLVIEYHPLPDGVESTKQDSCVIRYSYVAEWRSCLQTSHSAWTLMQAISQQHSKLMLRSISSRHRHCKFCPHVALDVNFG